MGIEDAKPALAAAIRAREMKRPRREMAPWPAL
jgi:hypothetical protein